MDTKNVSTSIIVPAQLSHTGEPYRKDIPIPSGLADIVGRLNHPAHGERPITKGARAPLACLPSVTMVDGRTLAVCANADEHAIASLALGMLDPGRAPRFRLVRDEDPTGISGTGDVAVGWAIGDTYVIRWRGPTATTTVHPGGYESIASVHLHGGLTRLVWINRERVVVGDGVSMVFSREASAFGRPGWLVAIDGRPDPTGYNHEICDGGPSSSDPRRGDHVVGLGDFDLDHHEASTVRRHVGGRMRVSRRTPGCGGDPSVITLGDAE